MIQRRDQPAGDSNYRLDSALVRLPRLEARFEDLNVLHTRRTSPLSKRRL
jgi:hypothetical protein